MRARLAIAQHTSSASIPGSRTRIPPMTGGPEAPERVRWCPPSKWAPPRSGARRVRLREPGDLGQRSGGGSVRSEHVIGWTSSPSRWCMAEPRRPWRADGQFHLHRFGAMSTSSRFVAGLHGNANDGGRHGRREDASSVARGRRAAASDRATRTRTPRRSRTRCHASDRPRCKRAGASGVDPESRASARTRALRLHMDRRPIACHGGRQLRSPRKIRATAHRTTGAPARAGPRVVPRPRRRSGSASLSPPTPPGRQPTRLQYVVKRAAAPVRQCASMNRVWTRLIAHLGPLEQRREKRRCASRHGRASSAATIFRIASLARLAVRDDFENGSSGSCAP